MDQWRTFTFRYEILERTSFELNLFDLISYLTIIRKNISAVKTSKCMSGGRRCAEVRMLISIWGSLNENAYTTDVDGDIIEQVYRNLSSKSWHLIRYIYFIDTLWVWRVYGIESFLVLINFIWNVFLRRVYNIVKNIIIHLLASLQTKRNNFVSLENMCKNVYIIKWMNRLLINPYT